MLYSNPMKWWEYLVYWRVHMNEYEGNQDVNMIKIYIWQKQMKEDENK